VAQGEAGVIAHLLPLGSVLDSFSGAFDFIFHQREAVTKGGVMVGGPSFVGHLAWTQLYVSALALSVSFLIAVPAGLYLGHRGKGEFLAIGLGNAARAIPELGVIAFLAAFIGVGLQNATIALMVLGIPPMLTNAFVAVRQVDRNAVEAARGMGMRDLQIIARVELPLAAPTIMSGIRTATTNIVATATIASIVGVPTLGKLILGQDTYGVDGVVAGAVVVALLALSLELTLAGVQRAVTPHGLKLQRSTARA
jgi:osmoprotectant transport system permease protein